MTEPQTKTVTVRHRGNVGIRFFHNAQGGQVVLRPGETAADVEVSEAEHKRLTSHSQGGIGDLEVEGAARREERRGEQRKELTREELNQLERENLEKATKSAPRPKGPHIEAGPRLDPSAPPHHVMGGDWGRSGDLEGKVADPSAPDPNAGPGELPGPDDLAQRPGQPAHAAQPTKSAAKSTATKKGK
jgi:hypothetical protein